MATPVFLPKLGKPVEEGIIRKWLVKEGERVVRYQPIAEVAFAKVDSEVVAPVTGILLKHCFPQGAAVSVDSPIAFIGEANDSISDAC